MVKKIAVCMLLVAAAVLPASAAAELTYSGSSTVGMGVLEAGAVKSFEEKTGIKFSSVQMPGSGKGLQAVLDGSASVAGVSRALTQKEIREGFVATEIGFDAIAVFVHNSNPVGNLTKEQLKAIFTGKIRNWSEVGGKNAPLHPNTEISGQKRATMLAFQEMVMDDAAYGEGFKQIDFPRDQIIETAKNENAICTVSRGLLSRLSPYLRSKVKLVTVNGIGPWESDILSGRYIISRPLLLVTKGKPKGEAKRFIDFMLSPDGQKVVGFNFVKVKN